MEHLGNTKLTETSVYKGLLLDRGIIWNSLKYECGGGGESRASSTKMAIILILLTILRQLKTLMIQM